MATNRSIGAYEAKTHLSQLLDEVAAGATITITKRGVPVAVLAPPQGASGRRMSFDEIVRGFDEVRKRAKPLGPDLTIRDLIEEGRRF